MGTGGAIAKPAARVTLGGGGDREEELGPRWAVAGGQGKWDSNSVATVLVQSCCPVAGGSYRWNDDGDIFMCATNWEVLSPSRGQGAVSALFTAPWVTGGRSPVRISGMRDRTG